jgi:hypothetical protein
MPPATLTRQQKRLIRTYALDRERLQGNDVTKVRLLSSGDARAYCADGDSYLIDPIAVLLEEAQKPKSSERGILVCPPTRIKNLQKWWGTIGGAVDSKELRFSILLFDRIVLPRCINSNIERRPDEVFLEQTGILRRPEYTFKRLDLIKAFVRAQSQAFIDLDKLEPGQWSLSQGLTSLLLQAKLLEPNVGALVELYRAIPIPDKDVPLTEILEFKRRRNHELQNLRSELDGFIAAINQAEDKEAELQKRVESVDAACADALRISSEWKFPVRLANFKASFEIRPFVTAIAGASAYRIGTAHRLGACAAILAGIGGAVAASTPSLKLAGDFGWRGLRPRVSPYRYVYKFHKELF